MNAFSIENVILHVGKNVALGWLDIANGTGKP
jgi:hypothetical protein